MSLQCPDHHATDHDEIMFAEWLESMRKDIECTFGILKSRFRILKNAIRLYFEDDIKDLFCTCAILHNILLQFDGFLNPDWVTVDPNVEEPEEDPEATQPLDMDPDQTQDIRDQPLQDANYQPTQHEPDDQIIEWNQNMFFELRGALVKNLAYQFRMGRVEWPKTFTADDKEAWTPHRIMERTAKRYQESISRVVYIRDSVLRRRDETGAFTMLGLFARTAFVRARRSSSSLVNCLPIWMNSMKSALDISRTFFIRRRPMNTGLGNGLIVSILEHKINALPQFPTVPLPALIRLLKEWRKQTAD